MSADCGEGSSVRADLGSGLGIRVTLLLFAWFERNANDAAPDTFDRGGLWVNLDGEAFAVVDVLEGGPAHAAGLRPGDQILSVDGKPASSTELPAFRALLRTRAPGQRVGLEVETGRKRHTVTVVLRELAKAPSRAPGPDLIARRGKRSGPFARGDEFGNSSQRAWGFLGV